MPGNPDKTLVVIAGPTAVGKTDIAVRLAQKLETEVVSADARQVYREMEIGTAPPSLAQKAAVKHHFVASHSVHQPLNAAQYGDQALAVIRQILSSHRYAILTGGSGLYIKSVLEGFDDMPAVEPGLRDELTSLFQTHGIEWLQQQLKDTDPDYFQVVDVQNPHRLIRALEVIRSTGIPFSQWRKKSTRALEFRVIKIGLYLPMEELYTRIDQRMDNMIAHGLFEEATSLYPLRHLQALQTVGYREIFDYIDGLYDRDEAIRLLKRNTRHYAKRQMTWFRRDAEFTWKRPDEWDEIVNLAVNS